MPILSYGAPPPVHAAFTHWRDLIKFQALLIKNDAAGARTWLSETEFDSIFLRLDDSFTLLMTLLHWGDRAAIGGVIQSYYSRDDLYPQLKSMVTLVKGRFELERGNFEGAARNLTGLGVVEFFRMNDAFVLRALLTSMGYLNECSPAEMLKLCQFQLCGTELALAEIFLGARPPETDECFPCPAWLPEWRLWLAIWFKHKNEHGRAHDMAQSIRNKRYGLLQCQTALDDLKLEF